MQSKALPWGPGGPQTREHFVARAVGYFVAAALSFGLGYLMLSSLVPELRNGSGPLLWVGAGLIAIASSLSALAVRDLRAAGKTSKDASDSPPATARATTPRGRKLVRAELVPGSPVDVKSHASEREMYIWLPPKKGWDGTTVPASARFLNVGFTWNKEEAVTVRLTRDQPEHFDPMQVPAWTPPGGARELLLLTYELEVIAHLTVPGGYSDIHYSVKRDTVEPRVVIYLA